jgi:hypothetical protein
MPRLPYLLAVLGLLTAGSARAQSAPAQGGAAPAEPDGSAATPAAAPAPAAQPEPPWTRLIGNHLLVFRYNPLGLEYQLRAGVQRRLYRSESAVFRDNFIFGGFYPKINPAFVKFGPSFEIQPLSVFNLRVAAELMGFFSSFGFLQSFNSPLVDYSDTALNAGRDAKRNYSTAGGHFMIEPSVQLKFGPIVVRDKLAIEYWRMNVKRGEKLFYEATVDTLLSANGWVIANDADLLFLHDFKDWKGTFRGARLTLGARYTLVKPLYQGSDFAPGDDPKAENNDHHRVGPIAAFTFFDHGYESFNRPTALLVANWYVDHRWRAGRDVSQALPYLILGFSAQTDLLK